MLIAITGGIGSGKSTVSDVLRVMGYAVYDCDAGAKYVMTADPTLRRELTEAFGPRTYRPDGQLDRRYLSGRIFGNAEALARMNALVHPAVGRDMMQWYAEAAPTAPGGVCFYESAILYESGFDRYADRVWCVSAPLELRVARAARRDRTSSERVQARIQSQMSQDEKERRADSIIHNDATHSVIEQVDRLIRSL